MTRQTYYFKQGFHDIDILDDRQNIILKATRKGNWLGKIKTEIEFENGKIISTHNSNVFYENFKVIENSTHWKINFVNRKSKLEIDNHIIESKTKYGIGMNFSIFLDKKEICKVSTFKPFKIFNDVRYKLEFCEDILDNDSIVTYTLIFLCLTVDILNS